MLKNRLKEVRKYLKIGSQKDFATSLNWAIGRVQDLESGKVKELKASEAEEIQEKFLIDGWWLLTGKGQMVSSETSNIPMSNDTSLMNIQRVSLKASAGAGNHLESIDKFEVVETMTISRSLLKTQPNGALRLISVDGHSMVPMLYPDSLVLFDEHPEWRGDGLYILNWRNELMVKILQIDPRGQLHIKSANKDYESWVVDPDDQSVFSIVGKVLRIII